MSVFDSYIIRCRLFAALGVPPRRQPLMHAWAFVEGRRFGHEFMGDLLCRRGSEKAVRVAIGRELNALRAFLSSSEYELGEIKRGGRSPERDITFYGHLAINRAVAFIQNKLSEDLDTANPLVSIDRHVSEAIARHIPKKKRTLNPKKNQQPQRERRETNYRHQSGHTFDLAKTLASLPLNSTFHDAVKLAKAGFPLFPVWGVTETGECRCSEGLACEKPGKHPLVRRWRQIATTYIPTLAKFALKHPYANWGIATGNRLPSGDYLTVMDIDERNFGHGSLSALERLELGPLPATREHSAGGGPHKFFIYSMGFHSSPGAIGQGIDVQSFGRFVIGAGMNARGKRYEVTNDIAIARLPDSWAKRIEAVKRKALPLIPEGQRRAKLISWAGGMVRDGMDHELIFRVLQDRREKRLEKGSHSFSDEELRGMIDYCARLERRKDVRVA